MRYSAGTEPEDLAEPGCPPALDVLRRAMPLPRCSSHEIVATSEFSLTNIDCNAGAGQWLHADVWRNPAIVLVRTGSFMRRVHGRTAMVDATQAYVLGPGDRELIGHTSDTGHRCTVVTVRPDLLPPLWLVRSRLTGAEFRTSPTADMTHRRLLAACVSGGDEATISCMATTLVAELLSCSAPAPRRGRRAPTAAAARRAVDIAREMATDHTGAPLTSIADVVGLSPHHLTRVFKASTGLTIGQYRNRVRVRLALEWLAEGGDDLTLIAHELGFSDHAHFSRTVLGEVGLQPRIARSLVCTGGHARVTAARSAVAAQSSAG